MPVIVSRIPGPDALMVLTPAAPALTEVLHLRWAEPVMAQPVMGGIVGFCTMA